MFGSMVLRSDDLNHKMAAKHDDKRTFSSQQHS